jgi:hypothetical protein
MACQLALSTRSHDPGMALAITQLPFPLEIHTVKDLDDLLRHALHLQKKSRIQVKIERPLVKDPVYDLYTNPANWRAGEPVSLVHKGPDGREVFLGIFLSMHNDRAHVRRLVPAHATIQGAKREVVSGDYWLHEQVTYIAQEETARERAEIEARFKELMSQYD